MITPSVCLHTIFFADMKIYFELMQDRDRQRWGIACGVPEADLLAAVSPRAHHLVIRILPQNWELKVTKI